LKLEYDPNCTYCLNNIFVIEAKQCVAQLESLKEEAKQKTEELTEIETKIKELSTPEKIRDMEEMINKMTYDKMTNHSKLMESQQKLEDLNHLKHNRQVENEIDGLLRNIKKLEEEINKLQGFIKLHTEIKAINDEINDLLIDKTRQERSLENDQKLLDKY